MDDPLRRFLFENSIFTAGLFQENDHKIIINKVGNTLWCVVTILCFSRLNFLLFSFLSKMETDISYFSFLKPALSSYVAWYPEGECYLNLAGIYNYLELPYYTSQDFENSGKLIHPTCKEMLDAYITPIFLEKAKLAGLDVPNFYISNGFFEPPVIIDPINPFITTSRIVRKPGKENSIAKSMTRNNTYAICCQDLPVNSKVVYFRSVLGWCTAKRFRNLSGLIWEHFQIPLAKVRVIVDTNNRLLVSDIFPLLLDSLTVKEKKYLEGKTQWER